MNVTNANNVAQISTTSVDKPLEYLFIFYAVALPISISATNLALVLIILYCFIKLHKSNLRTLPLINRKLFTLGMLLFSWAALTSIANKGYIQKTDISNIWEYSPIVLFPIFLYFFNIRKEKVILALLSISSLICLLGIIQYCFPDLTYPFPKQPIRLHAGSLPAFMGFNSHHLHSGGFYSITTMVTFALCLFWRCEHKMKVLLWIFFLLNLTGLLLTIARGYYIALFFTIPLLLFFKNKRCFFGGCTVLILFLIVIITFENPVNGRIKSIFEPTSGSNVRMQIWEKAFEMFKDKPLMGIGKNNWKKELKRKYATGLYDKQKRLDLKRQRRLILKKQKSLSKKQKGSSKELKSLSKELKSLNLLPIVGHAHNIYLTWLSETGIIGLALFISFWWIVAWTLFTKIKAMPRSSFQEALVLGSFGSLLNLFIGGIFENNFETSIILLLISLIIGLSLSNQSKNSKQVTHKKIEAETANVPV